MDVVTTIYKELFNIKFVHEGYSLGTNSAIFNEVKVVPDANTQQLFNRFDIGYRCVNDTIICFIRSVLAAPPAKEPKKPYTFINEDISIRFLLSASKGFLNSTYVAASGSKVVYHFTNKINNVQASNHYLTKTIEDFNGAKDYDAGTIVNNAGEPFVTLQPVNAVDGIAINNTAYWKKVLPSEQVVNNADLENVAIVKNEESCFAVIDVYNTGTTNATYNLFDADEQLLSPVYVIPFKSKI